MCKCKCMVCVHTMEMGMGMAVGMPTRPDDAGFGCWKYSELNVGRGGIRAWYSMIGMWMLRFVSVCSRIVAFIPFAVDFREYTYTEHGT